MARRIDSLDVARGTAMLFVCLSHFSFNFLSPWSKPGSVPNLRTSLWFATTISMIASPTFIALSALVIGYLYRAQPAGMSALRWKLIDRGLFLLIIGHLIQAPAYSESGKLEDGLRVSFITDVIAFAIIFGPSLVMRTARTSRLIGGTVLLVMSWIVAARWAPESSLGYAVARYGLGVVDSEGKFAGFPILPWFAVYLLMTVVGEWLGEQARTSRLERGALLLFRIGAACAAAGLIVTIARHALRVVDPAFLAAHGDLGFIAVSRKFPPGPVYLLFFGGCGLILISRAFFSARSTRFAHLTQPLAVLGRASFFVFILQGYLYYIIVPAMKLPFPLLWPAYFLASIALLLGAAALWDRVNGNRYLSVGLGRAVPLARTVRAKILPAPAAH